MNPLPQGRVPVGAPSRRDRQLGARGHWQTAQAASKIFNAENAEDRGGRGEKQSSSGYAFSLRSRRSSAFSAFLCVLCVQCLATAHRGSEPWPLHRNTAIATRGRSYRGRPSRMNPLPQGRVPAGAPSRRDRQLGARGHWQTAQAASKIFNAENAEDRGGRGEKQSSSGYAFSLRSRRSSAFSAFLCVLCVQCLATAHRGSEPWPLHRNTAIATRGRSCRGGSVADESAPTGPRSL